jgi:polyisoprenoid-binding protein YceI
MTDRSNILKCSLVAIFVCLCEPLFSQTNQLPLIFADTARDVVLVGKVTGFDFSSPESTIEVEVESSSGQPSRWSVLTKSATELRRLGWTSQSLFIGELVQVKGELIQGSRLSVDLSELLRANGEYLLPEKESIFDLLESGSYRAVESQGSIQISFDHHGFSRSIFYFNSFDAQLELDAEEVSNSRFQLDLLTEDLDSGSFELTRVLKSGAFFDSSNFPLISVSATRIEQLNDSALLVLADISIKGITQPAQFEIKLNKVGMHPETESQAIGFSGVALVNRTDWGFFDYFPEIDDQILIELEMEFALATQPLLFPGVVRPQPTPLP